MSTTTGVANKVVLVGAPWDVNSSMARGAAEAPPLIRAALFGGSANLTAESGICLEGHPRLLIEDDLCRDDASAFADIEERISGMAERGAMPLVLGGDHAVTYPVIRALARRHGPLNILHFDAHPDLYDEYEGNRLSHACPFARIMEERLAVRLVQVGIRTLNEPQREQAARFGVEIHEMRSFDVASFDPDLASPAYLSFDMDGLDPAFAPGVSHFEPGGLSVRDVLTIIHKLRTPLIGADIVEYNPRHDINGMTAMVGAKLAKEIASVMLQVGQ